MNPFVEKISPVHQMQTKTVDTMADIIAKIPNDEDQAKFSSRSFIVSVFGVLFS